MLSNRRDYALSKDQPILQRARRRNRANGQNRSEADFWLHFDLEKFACDWQRELRQQRAGYSSAA